MKKYTIAIAAFLLVAGMASAQTASKTGTSNPTAKVSHSTTAKKTSSSTASVTPTSSTSSNNSTAAIKRKHHRHKKTKSVPKSSN